MSWCPHAAVHLSSKGIERSPNETFLEEHFKSFLNYLRFSDFLELVFTALGVFWAFFMYVVNTGAESEDTNSLQTLFALTFCGVIVLILVSFVMFIRNQMSELNIPSGFMPLSDSPDSVSKTLEHLSFTIER